MNQASYVERRGEIEHYFDRTAAKAWEVLTSNAPVGRIRATVRKGRDEMRHTLLSWLPEDMRGLRLLDAGCGTGALAQEAMRRWSLGDVLVLHRFGEMRAGDRIMMVATAARHRKDAFEAAEFLMDYLKSRAPFWKKEYAADGASWVAAKSDDEDALSRW